MSAPPLPPAFGNYALGEFVEVVSPAAVSWLPQTLGWWWLGALLLGLALYRGWKMLRRWYRNRYRREALKRLQLLAAGDDGKPPVSDINKLLKLTALAAYSREQVARLYGQEWVDFLNGQCPAAPFRDEQALLLAQGSYRENPLQEGAIQQLIAASLTWIREHESPVDA